MADGGDEPRCPVCLVVQGSEEDTLEWTTQRCGHQIHTQCALGISLRGNVSCCLCRRHLVDDLSEMGVEDARERLEEEAEETRRRRALRRGLQRAKRADCPLRLRLAVLAYKRAQQQLAEAQAERSAQQAALTQVKREFAERLHRRCVSAGAPVDGVVFKMPTRSSERVMMRHAKLMGARRRVEHHAIVLDADGQLSV